MFKKQENAFWRDTIIGIICNISVSGLIILLYSTNKLLLFICLTFWTLLWLLFYTQHISDVAIQLHEERKRKATLPSTDDINKIVWKGGKGQCLKM